MMALFNVKENNLFTHDLSFNFGYKKKKALLQIIYEIE